MSVNFKKRYELLKKDSLERDEFIDFLSMK